MLRLRSATVSMMTKKTGENISTFIRLRSEQALNIQVNTKIQKQKEMSETDFTTTLTVDKSPKEAFQAITNVRGWWSEEIEGGTAKLNDVFDYHFRDVHRCKIKLTEVIPDQKVVWWVMDNYFNFTKDKSEWKDTTISFEITRKDDKTQIRMTHHGLVPDYECYDICQDSWTNYMQHSLRDLIMTGKGKPNSAEKSQTENERKLSKS